MISKVSRFTFSIFLIMFFFISVQSANGEEKYFEGIIEPSELVRVSSPVEGILSEVLVDRGDRVIKDQVIASLNSQVEKAAVDLAIARVEFSKRKVDRNKDLYKKQLVSIHEKDEMETELEIAKLQKKEAMEKLEIRTIRSPVDGVIVERFLSPGEFVGNDPVMSIAQIDPLYVEVVIPAEEFGKIKKGSLAVIKLESPVLKELKAKVSVVDQVIDAASGTFGVRLVLPNPAHSLPAGIKCRVVF